MPKEALFSPVVQNPLTNSHPQADFLFRYPESNLWRTTLRDMEQNNIYAYRFPRLVDLCAGCGSAAALFETLGWRDPTCIDHHIPKKYKVLPKRSSWLYWDLGKLGAALKKGLPLNETTLKLKEQFDFATITFPDEDVPDYIVELGYFFLKPGGLYYAPQDTVSLARLPNQWQRFGSAKYFYQKRE